jgi:hypothetical protein
MNKLEIMLKKESKSKLIVANQGFGSPVLKYEKFSGEQKIDVS